MINSKVELMLKYGIVSRTQAARGIWHDEGGLYNVYQN
jgi:hypothetical protein